MADHAAWNPPRPLAANVKAIETHLTIRPVRTDMETHLVRRPVYGGPGRIGLIGMATQGNLAGGPGVLRTPGRRPPHRNGGTFGSFGHERTTINREDVKKTATKLSWQVSCKANSAKANKEKSNARGAVPLVLSVTKEQR